MRQSTNHAGLKSLESDSPFTKLNGKYSPKGSNPTTSVVSEHGPSEPNASNGSCSSALRELGYRRRFGSLAWCSCDVTRDKRVNLYLKPVLNWANVCSPNILRTVRQTMIRFLIELLVRQTCFGQFDELYFVLTGLTVIWCKLRPELAADAQQTAWSKM